MALDLILSTRDECEYFGDPDLAACVLDRALDEEETLAVCVVPNGVFWMVDPTLEAESMASFLRQTEEYAEIQGAPEGGLWQRGFWYRPIRCLDEATARGEAIGRLPMDKGLARRFGRWPGGVWMGCGVTSETLM